MPAKKNARKSAKKAAKTQPKQNHAAKRKAVVARSSASFGSRVGAFLGDAAEKLIYKVVGLGDYKIESNTLLSGSLPSFGGEMVTTFSRREFLGDVKSSVGFATTAYPINPGMARTFPWGSRLAPNFEQYRLRGLLFEFKTTCGSAISSTNNALGVVVMSTQYDPLEAPFTSKQEQEAYVFTSSSVPSQSQLHAVECKPSLSAIDALYVRSADPPEDADLRFYDHGTFYISTSGMQAADVTIGELWVTYHVELLKPRLPGQLSTAQAMSWTMQSLNNNIAATTPTLYEYTALFATASTSGNRARVTFNPHVVGLYRVLTRTFATAATITDNLQHPGWGPAGNPQSYLGTSGSGSISYMSAADMNLVFSANWSAAMSVAPEDSSSTFMATRYAQSGVVPCDLYVVTEQWVRVDNSGGGTGWVETPTLFTVLTSHVYSLLSVERVGPSGLPLGHNSPSSALRPPPRGSGTLPPIFNRNEDGWLVLDKRESKCAPAFCRV